MNNGKSTCFACGEVFVREVTDIARVVIVGPRYHGRLGKIGYVCSKHWLVSVSNETEEENTLESAAIELESETFIAPSPVLKPTRPRRSLTLKRKRLVFDEPEKVSGVRVLGEGSGGKLAKLGDDEGRGGSSSSDAVDKVSVEVDEALELASDVTEDGNKDEESDISIE